LPLADRRFVLSAGVGPYRYADTVQSGPNGFMNDHGWGALMSVRAAYYTSDRSIKPVHEPACCKHPGVTRG
jgi:hypothetical protein